MGIFQKRNHPLPKFPPQVRGVFKYLCKRVPVEELDSLRLLLREATQSIRTRMKDDENYDSQLAVRLAETCKFLLDIYPDLTQHQQTLVSGAVRYFVQEDDPLPEEVFAVGFDDDVRVVNHVLEELGIHDRYLSRPE